MQTGSLAELVSAFAALGALVAAVVAAFATLRTYQQQQEEQRQRNAAEERSASSKVAVWARTDRGVNAALRYINASDLPIYALTVWVVIPGRCFEVFYSVVGPSPESRTLRRGTALMQEKAVADGLEVNWKSLLESDRIAAAITFRDLGNRWWHRQLSGELKKYGGAEEARRAASEDIDIWLAKHGEG